jgi:hypothetical protein
MNGNDNKCIMSEDHPPYHHTFLSLTQVFKTITIRLLKTIHTNLALLSYIHWVTKDLENQIQRVIHRTTERTWCLYNQFHKLFTNSFSITKCFRSAQLNTPSVLMLQAR